MPRSSHRRDNEPSGVQSIMKPLPRPPRVGKLRLKKDCFGFKQNEEATVIATKPTKEQLIEIEHAGEKHIARYYGLHVELPDGKTAWFYRLVGVLGSTY